MGGRTFSYVDDATGDEVDNGQHVFMRCCSRYIAFLKRLGVLHKTHLQSRCRVPISAPGGRSAIFALSRWPQPFHFLPAVLSYPHLTRPERLRVLRAAVPMMLMSEQRRHAVDTMSFYDWLRAHGQSERAIERFWNVIVMPILNDHSRDVSADQAIMVFQVGFFGQRHAADLGYSRVGLTTLLAPEAMDYLAERGAQITFGARVTALEVQENRVTGVRLSDGRLMTGDAYISALPHHALWPLLPEAQQQDAYFARINELGTSPIVNLHLWFDRPLMKEPFAAFVDSPAQWVFNRSAISGKSAGPQHVAVSLSGAHQYIDADREALIPRFVEELRRLFPSARELALTHSVVIKERQATFSASPGSLARRPGPRTPVANLFLAGEWTATGWPSTMEGAVRSGERAAEVVMKGESG